MGPTAADRPLRATGFRTVLGAALLGAAGLMTGLAGCGGTKTEPPKAQIKPRYDVLPARENVPAFMKGTVWEYADLENTVPYPVSSFGMVVGLNDTGDNTGTPLAVRNYIRDEMVKHGFGSQEESLKPYVPERVLEDPRMAVVEVYGLLPPGARAGQRMDVFVRAVEGSGTRSLSRGILYQCDLRINGANRLNPRGAVNIFAKAKGPIFVNPSVSALDPKAGQSQTMATLRQGLVMNGGMVIMDRPLRLRVRQPQLSIARAMEMRTDQRFEDLEAARTQDEAYVNVLVPTRFNGDWEHFAGVLTHLYLNPTPGFGAVKARELAEEAMKPGAPLKDISFCWEGIGMEALPFIQPLYANASREVAYAAARAGAFIRDAAAEEALLSMATNDNHPFQLNAVTSLAALPMSRRLERMLTQVMSVENPLARVEAYHALVKQNSIAIHSKEVRDTFVLDLVSARGTPMVYATQTGVPRIALFGQGLSLKTPIIFSALDSKLTISTPTDGKGVTVFDRTSGKVGGSQARMEPELQEIIYRLGGGKRQQGDEFNMSYSDLIAVLKSLSEGRYVSANFILQDSPALQDEIENAPPLPGELTQQAAEPDAMSDFKQLQAQ